MSIFSDSGVPLYQTAPLKLSFNPSGALGPNQSGSQVFVNGEPITGASAHTPVQSGAIAGLVQLRDTIAPQYQSQLDQIAGNLVSAFQETDQSTTAPGLPALPGLFTVAGATSVPASANYTGLAKLHCNKRIGRPDAGRRRPSAPRRRHFRHEQFQLYI